MISARALYEVENSVRNGRRPFDTEFTLFLNGIEMGFFPS